jgi:hypothetical protein
VKVDTLKRQRIEARLIGEFDWSLYQRGFDGLRIDLVKPAWTITGIAFHPTSRADGDAIVRSSSRRYPADGHRAIAGDGH